MRGDGRTVGRELDPVDIRLDPHRLEGVRPRYAVAVGVVHRGLVLVDLPRVVYIRINMVLGQFSRAGFVLDKSLTNRLSLSRLLTIQTLDAAWPQIYIYILIIKMN